MNTKQLKKALSLAFVLCLLAGSLPAQARETAPVSQLFGARLMDTNDNVLSIAALDGTSYILTEKALYIWREGEAEARFIADIAPQNDNGEDPDPRATALFVHEGRLMGLDGGRGLIYTLLTEGGMLRFEQALALDWSDFEEGDGRYVHYDSPGHVVYDAGRLYVSRNNWGGDLACDLYGFDLADGRITRYSPKHIKGLVPYRDGKLLGLYYDQNRYNPETYEQYLAEPVIFDPAADSAEPANLRLPAPVGYDNNSSLRLCAAPDGQIYAANNSAVYRVSKDAEPVLTGRLPMSGSWGGAIAAPGMLPLDGDRLLAAFGSNVFIRGTDESKLKPVTALKLNEDLSDTRALTKTLMQMDDIVVEVYQGEWQGANTISTLFLTGALDYDILSIGHNYFDTQKMTAKGYFAALDDAPALSAYADDMFELFDPFIRREGKTYLLPISLDAYYPAANAQNIKDTGAEPPRSIPELLNLTRWWGERYEQFEGYVLFDQADVKQVLKFIALEVYINACLGEKKPLRFDMEPFGNIMREIDALDVSDFDVRIEELEDEGYMGGKPLIMNGMGGGIRRDEYNILLELSLDGNLRPWAQGRARYLGIPSTGKNQEAAKRFLSAYLRNMDPVERAALSRTQTEPILNPRYDEEYAEQLRYLSEYEARAEKATGAEKTEFEQDAAYFKERAAGFEQNNKYLVSTEDLARRKDMMSRIYLSDSLGIVQQNALNNAEGGSYLPYMYYEGAITLEQFMEDANARIRLMTLEAQ